MLYPWWPLRGHAVLERTARSRSPGLCCTALGRQQRTLRLPQNRHITRSAAAPRAEAPSDRRNVGGSGAAAHLVTFEAGGSVFTCAPTARAQLRLQEETQEGYEYVVVLPGSAAAVLLDMLRVVESSSSGHSSPTPWQQRTMDGDRTFIITIEPSSALQQPNGRPTRSQSTSSSNGGISDGGSSSGGGIGEDAGSGEQNGAAISGRAIGTLSIWIQEEGRNSMVLPVASGAARAGLRQLQALLDSGAVALPTRNGRGHGHENGAVGVAGRARESNGHSREERSSTRGNSNIGSGSNGNSNSSNGLPVSPLDEGSSTSSTGSVGATDTNIDSGDASANSSAPPHAASSSQPGASPGSAGATGPQPPPAAAAAPAGPAAAPASASPAAAAAATAAAPPAAAPKAAAAAAPAAAPATAPAPASTAAAAAVPAAAPATVPVPALTAAAAPAPATAAPVQSRPGANSQVPKRAPGPKQEHSRQRQKHAHSSQAAAAPRGTDAGAAGLKQRKAPSQAAASAARGARPKTAHGNAAAAAPPPPRAAATALAAAPAPAQPAAAAPSSSQQQAPPAAGAAAKLPATAAALPRSSPTARVAAKAAASTGGRAPVQKQDVAQKPAQLSAKDAEQLLSSILAASSVADLEALTQQALEGGAAATAHLLALWLRLPVALAAAPFHEADRAQALAARLIPALRVRLAATAPGMIQLVLEAAEQLQQLLKSLRPAEQPPLQLPAEWLDECAEALRLHLGAMTLQELSAVINRLSHLGARPSAQWVSSASEAITGLLIRDLSAAEVAVQLLAWAAAEDCKAAAEEDVVTTGAAGVVDAASFNSNNSSSSSSSSNDDVSKRLNAALAAMVPDLGVSQIGHLVRSVDSLPGTRGRLVEDGMWRWLQSEASLVPLVIDQLCELLRRLPHPPPPPPGQIPSAAGASGAAVQNRAARSGGSSGGGEEGGDGATGLLEVLRLQLCTLAGAGAQRQLEGFGALLLVTADKDADVALMWLPEALSWLAHQQQQTQAQMQQQAQVQQQQERGALQHAALTRFGSGSSVSDAAVEQLSQVLGSLATLDSQRVLVAVVPVAHVLSQHAAGLSAGSFQAASQQVLWMCSSARQLAAVVEDGDLPPPATAQLEIDSVGSSSDSSSGEQWAAAAAEAARLWLDVLTGWAASHAAGLSKRQLASLLTDAAALHDIAGVSADGLESSGGERRVDAARGAWLQVAEVALLEVAGDSSPLADDEFVTASCAASRLGRPLTPQLLDACLAAAARCHLGLPAASLCELLALLGENFGGASSGGLPPRLVTLANSVCTALAAKGVGAAGGRPLLRATAAMAQLAARGGGAGASGCIVATVQVMDSMLGSGSGGGVSCRGGLDGGSGQSGSGGVAVGWQAPAQAAAWVVRSWAEAAQEYPATCLLGFSPGEAATLIASLADCDTLAFGAPAKRAQPALSVPASAAAAMGAAGAAAATARRHLQPMLVAAAGKVRGAVRFQLPAGAAAAAALALAQFARRGGVGGGGDDTLAVLSADCLERLVERAVSWPVEAQLRLLSCMVDVGIGGGVTSGSAMSHTGAVQKLVASALAGLEESSTAGDKQRRHNRGSESTGDDANGDDMSLAAAEVAWAVGLMGSLGVIEAVGGGRLSRSVMQKLLGRVRVGYEAAAKAGRLEGVWPRELPLQYVQVCCAHRVPPSPTLLAAAIEAAAAAPAGTVPPELACQLLLLHPKRQETQRPQPPSSSSSAGSSGASSGGLVTVVSQGAVAALLTNHLQPHLGQLSVQRVYQLLMALGAMEVDSLPDGFAAAVASSLQSCLVLLPKGRHLLLLLEVLLIWGHRPSGDFMRSFYAAADVLLDTFSATSCLNLLGACWQVAEPNRLLRSQPTSPSPSSSSSSSAAAAAAARRQRDGGLFTSGVSRPPAPPPELAAALLRALEGRSITPEAAAEGLRLLGRLRLRPSPALLLHWLGSMSRSGALGALPPRLLLCALHGVCELRVAPPAAWVDSLLQGLAPAGRMTACAPETLAGILLCLHKLGVVPAPVFRDAVVDAVLAAREGVWDAESLSVALGCLADWGSLPAADRVRDLVRRAAAAAGAARPGAAAARLFLWWQGVRGCEEGERLVAGIPQDELFASDIAHWGATLRALPQASAGVLLASGDFGGGLPRQALVPLFVVAVAAVMRDPSAAPPAWLDRAWRGAVAAAAAREALTTSEAAALLISALVQAPAAQLWDLGVAQAVLRAGYRARKGACAQALWMLRAASDVMRTLAMTVPAYEEHWMELLEGGRLGEGDVGEDGAPGLPGACVEELLRAYEEASGREREEVWVQYRGIVAGLGDTASGEEGWGSEEHMLRMIQEGGLLETRSVQDDILQLRLAVTEAVSEGWVEAGLDD